MAVNKYEPRNRLEGVDPCRVGSTWVDDETWVSTVFLGLDHNWGPGGPPVLFKTMVFRGAMVSRGDSGEEQQWRYTSWDAAAAGHAAVVAWLRDERAGAGE
jgi:hypothetical protein